MALRSGVAELENLSQLRLSLVGKEDAQVGFFTGHA